jgi:hypothetical protein
VVAKRASRVAKTRVVAAICVLVLVFFCAVRKHCGDPAPGVIGGRTAERIDAAESAPCATIVRGRVSSDGRAISNATISVDSGDRVSVATHTAVDGSFSLPANEPSRVIVEAIGYELAATSTLGIVRCKTIEVEIELSPETAANEPPAKGAIGTLEIEPAETATVAIMVADKVIRFGSNESKFRVPAGLEPPYYVYAEGADWVAARLEVWDPERPVHVPKSARRPRAVTEELGRNWRFSSAAGLYFMEKEATVGEYEGCVAKGACKARQVQYANPFGPPCISTKLLPVNCVTSEDAKSFCAHIKGCWALRLERKSRGTDHRARRATRELRARDAELES